MVRTTRLAVPGASIAAVFASMAANPILARHLPVFDKPNDQGVNDAEFKTAVRNLNKVTEEVKSFAEKANTEIKNLGTVSGETKEKVDEALTKMNTLSASVADMEQKLARRPAGGGEVEHKSIGQRFTESAEYKAAAAEGMRWKGRCSVEVKTITSASASGASSTTALVPADRQPGVIMQAMRPFAVRDLIAPGRTNSSSIEYVKENVVSLNAASVAENPSAPKPQSDLSYLQTNTSVRTIAHFIMASKQIMDDAPQLESMIDQRLRYGLGLVEDQQLLTGDGTGQNLLGLVPQATPYAKPAGITVQNQTQIDTLRLAMLQATLALYPSTGIVLHPIDWTQIELTKDTQNRYLFANPQGIAGPVLWGQPIAQSFAMTPGQFLTGALRYAAQIFDREDANVMMSTEDRDNFVKNMVTILAEERLALAVYRPQALITGALAPS